MSNSSMTMLILSCDKFSDLWDGHVHQLEKNWPDRNFNTFIVTDNESKKNYSSVNVLVAGNVEWSERLKFALDKIETEYVFITLDDYFLINKVTNNRIYKLIDMMESEQIEYVRLYQQPKKSKGVKLKGYKGIYTINTDICYCVNLYSGIWKKAFIERACQKPKNAWQFEVSLSKIARLYNAKCVVSYNDDFLILDVVRKGKLLHKSARYFKDHPELYNGTRELNSYSYEFKLWIKTIVSRHAPKPLHYAIKMLLIKMGIKFYSQDSGD